MFKRFPPFLFAALLSGLVAGTLTYLSKNGTIEHPEKFNPVNFVEASLEAVSPQPDKLLMKIDGPWFFSIGDQSEWSSMDFDHSNWQKVEAGETWENQGFEAYDGYAWYRKEILIPAMEDEAELVLKMGKIDDSDELFFNGKLIGATGGMPPNYHTGYHDIRRYALATTAIRWGETNVIAVRVYDGGGEGGLREGFRGLYVTAPKPKPQIDLSGTWEFVTEPVLEQYGEEAEWHEIKVPASWESQGFPDYDGFAWYRKTVTVPSTFRGETFVLLLGKIDDLDEVFIDGKKVASTGFINQKETKLDGNEWEAQRGYYIPDGIVKVGKPHEIAIRVYDHTGDGGIYEGPVGIITQKKYIEFWKKNRNRLE